MIFGCVISTTDLPPVSTNSTVRLFHPGRDALRRKDLRNRLVGLAPRQGLWLRGFVGAEFSRW